MKNELRFATVYVVTFRSGCPEEGMPFTVDDRFFGETREEAEEWIARSDAARLYDIEERCVLTDGRVFVPVAARGFDSLEGVALK